MNRAWLNLMSILLAQELTRGAILIRLHTASVS